jgi:hypothetical protein
MARTQQENAMAALQGQKVIVDLSSSHFGARMYIEQVARKLNFSEDDITVLISADHLVPLGDPDKFGRKTFATITIYEHALDVKWLHKAVKLTTKNSRDNHARYPRKAKLTSSSPESQVSKNKKPASYLSKKTGKHKQGGEITEMSVTIPNKFGSTEAFLNQGEL